MQDFGPNGIRTPAFQITKRLPGNSIIFHCFYNNIHLIVQRKIDTRVMTWSTSLLLIV